MRVWVLGTRVFTTAAAVGGQTDTARGGGTLRREHHKNSAPPSPENARLFGDQHQQDTDGTRTHRENAAIEAPDDENDDDDENGSGDDHTGNHQTDLRPVRTDQTRLLAPGSRLSLALRSFDSLANMLRDTAALGGSAACSAGTRW